jgi:hypothetical protein
MKTNFWCGEFKIRKRKSSSKSPKEIAKEKESNELFRRVYTRRLKPEETKCEVINTP